MRHKGNHASLLDYIQQRLNAGKQARDDELPRWVGIDKKVAGWIALAAEDAKRKKAAEETGIPVLTDINLPLAFVHLDDMMTYYAATFAPNRGMFYQVGNPQDNEASSPIVTKMNNDALYGGYFREVLLGIFSMLKYNAGGFHVEWSKDYGPKFEIGEESRTFAEEVRWQGNRIEAVDRYNFLCDTSVHPSKLHCDGEFAGVAKLRSRYWLQHRASKGVYFVPESVFDGPADPANTEYYRSPPREASLESGGDVATTNWVSVLRGSNDYLVGGHELVTIYIRLNPMEFGLIQGPQAKDRSRYEIWRFTILDNEHIIEATYMNNVHNQIPYYMGLIHDDLMGTSQKAVSELLTPLQDFASALLNVHTRANRSSLWGLTLYDPTVVDLSQVPAGETAARIPIKPAGYGKDLRQAVQTQQTNLDTKQTLQDVDMVMNVINQFFPTQSLPSQIASIDRAVTDQVAAVQQGANRRQQKSARLIDDSVFRNVRNAMYYNVIQYQPAREQLVDFFSGKAVELDLTKIKDANLPFIIGQGLKAIDRQASASMMQQVIFALIQAPQAAQGIDLLAMIDHWTSMIDIETDMNQFRLPPPPPPGADGQPAVGPDGQPLDPAAGPAINPATNPQRLTAPIYGGNSG